MASEAYDAVPTRVPMKPSPSAIYNNLTTAVGLGSLVYAHRAQACVVQPASAVPGTPIPVRKVECQCQDNVHSVKVLPHGDRGYLVLATEGGVQVWDKVGHHVLLVWTFPDTPDTVAADPGAAGGSSSDNANGVGTRHLQFARGACINRAEDDSAQICFGSSSGALYVFQIDSDGGVTGQPASFQHHKAPITALSSGYQSRHGRWMHDQSSSIVSADEGGGLTVWRAQSATSYTSQYELGSSSTPAVSLAVRNDYVIAARLSGCIQIFSMKDKALTTEMVAHSRWLTAMDIHPTKDLVVSGAEDGTIGVWTLPIGAQKATALFSCTWMHACVTGVAFCGPTLDIVAAVAYDTDELQLYKANKPT